MTDAISAAERAAYLILIDRERCEAAFNKAVDDCRRLQSEHPGEDIYVDREIVDAVEDLIFAQPLKTFGDVRLYAQAWLERDQDELEAHERRLLEALAALPQRLWGEPIAAG